MCVKIWLRSISAIDSATQAHSYTHSHRKPNYFHNLYENLFESVWTSKRFIPKDWLWLNSFLHFYLKIRIHERNMTCANYGVSSFVCFLCFVLIIWNEKMPADSLFSHQQYQIVTFISINSFPLFAWTIKCVVRCFEPRPMESITLIPTH